MARKDDFTGTAMHCVVCQNPIPPDRKWDAVTCSKECTKKRQDFRRSRTDHSFCRYCMKPSTPEQRVKFQRWWKAEQKQAREAAAAAGVDTILANTDPDGVGSLPTEDNQ